MEKNRYLHFTPEGKPGISVYDHMINVGCVARCIAETMPELLERFQLGPLQRLELLPLEPQQLGLLQLECTQLEQFLLKLFELEPQLALLLLEQTLLEQFPI